MSKTVTIKLDDGDVEVLWALRFLGETRYDGRLGIVAGDVLRRHLKLMARDNEELRDAMADLRRAKETYRGDVPAPARHLALVR